MIRLVFIIILVFCFSCKKQGKSVENDSKTSVKIIGTSKGKIENPKLEINPFSFESSKLIINGVKVDKIDKDNIILLMGFLKKIDEEGSEYFYKGKSYAQFYKGELIYISVEDNNLSFENPKISIGDNIDNFNFLKNIMKKNIFEAVHYGNECKGISYFDSYENELTIFFKNNNILNITYKPFFDMESFDEDVNSPAPAVP